MLVEVLAVIVMLISILILIVFLSVDLSVLIVFLISLCWLLEMSILLLFCNFFLVLSDIDLELLRLKLCLNF